MNAQMQPCRRVAGEPGDEVVVRIKAGTNRVTPVLPIKHGQVLPDEVVSLFIGASGSLRSLVRQMVAMTAASTYLFRVGVCRPRRAKCAART
ncbi:hypothetical protein [Micromonospora sp. NPDC049171]|uniref:hypothetical protein n=1 Tax=Micromonospora sp. NPDC049171 TaxID=3155770 RepID=UPI003401C244